MKEEKVSIRFCPYCGNGYVTKLNFNKPYIQCVGCEKIFTVIEQ